MLESPNLQSSFYFDYEAENIEAFLGKLELDSLDNSEKARRIYLAVRDKIRYDPYNIVLVPDELKASSVLQRGYGYCVEKAITLVACARLAGIPAKIGFANVKNHLNSKRLQKLMKTDIFVFHGYADIFLNGKWVKATPAFNASLCERAGILPLEFNGTEDSIFHAFDKSGKKHMEYIKDYGSFTDFPFEKMMDEYEVNYPHLRVREIKKFGELNSPKFEKEVINSLLSQ